MVVVNQLIRNCDEIANIQVMEKVLWFLDQKFDFFNLLVHYKCFSESLLEGRMGRDSIKLLIESLYCKIKALMVLAIAKEKT